MHKRKILFLIAVLLFIVPFLHSRVDAKLGASNPGGPPPFVANEVLISFLPGITPPQIAAFYSQHGLIEKKRLRKDRRSGPQLRLAQIKPPGTMGNPSRFIRNLGQDARVNFAELNYLLYLDQSPNDADFGDLWGLNNNGKGPAVKDADIDAPEAWDITTGSSNVIVGIIDTGVDYNHPDLAANIWTNPGEVPGNGIDDDANGYIDDVHGINAITGTGDPIDNHGHGTHVAGTIGAIGNNGIGVVGVNWQVSMVACKFLGATGGGNTADAIECFDYFNQLRAKGYNVRITNNSWGGGGFSQALKDAMEGDTQAPILHAVAAGNSNNDNDLSPSYPASYDLDNIVSVAATDYKDNYADFSSYGATSVDLAAPGVNILSTLPSGTCALCDSTGYGALDGTSMATPHVAGVAALIWSAYPGVTTPQVIQRLLHNNDQLGNSAKQTATNSRLNAFKALVSDPTPPSQVTSLSATGSGLSWIGLSWIAPGDDGTSGSATTYDLRYATFPISESNWETAILAAGEPDPKPVGSTENLTLMGLSPGSRYYLALKVQDNVGNESTLSNVASETTISGGVVWEDDLEGSSSGWAASGLWVSDNFRSTSTSQSWYYGQPSSRNYNTGSPNSGTLTSPEIDLGDAREGFLSFQEWLQIEEIVAPDCLQPASSDRWDCAVIQVSADGGVWESLSQSYRTGGEWKEKRIDLTSYAGKKIRIRFSFDTVDDFFNNFEGWYIDDLKVIADQPQAPPTANTAPAALPVNAVVDEDASVPVSLIATDPEQCGLVFALLSGPSNGFLDTIGEPTCTSGSPHSSQALVNYTPDPDFNGIDSFTYYANDGMADSNVATVSITVNSVNDAPVAVNDAYFTIMDTTLNVGIPGVLSNDSDIDGTPLSVVLVSGPTSGVLVLNANGSFAYTPNTGFTGNATFTYHASDGAADSNTGTVSIAVNPVNQAPVAEDDSYSTASNTALTVEAPGVLDNDTDSDGNTLNAVLVSGPTNGTLSLNSDGSFAYTPNATYTGNDTFTYLANDGTADSNVATVSVNVTSSGTDTVTILKATYNWKKQKLALEANTSAGGSETLWVYLDGGSVPVGSMIYVPKRDKYKANIDSPAKPATVTVLSSGGGSATITQQDIGGKGG